jgi:hypothetical protein
MAQGILSGCFQEVNRPRSPILTPFRMEKRGEYLAIICRATKFKEWRAYPNLDY